MIKIELALMKDLEKVKNITDACALDMISKNIYQWNSKYPSIQVFRNDIKNKRLYVAKDNKYKIVGCISLGTQKDIEYKDVKWLTKDDNNLYVHRLAVDPKFQKKGIGKSLMDFAENYARTKDFKSIRLDTFSQNKRNNKFYKSRDYIQLEDVFFLTQSESPFHCYEKKIN